MKIMNKEKLLKYFLYAFAFFLPIQARYIIKAGEGSGEIWEYGTYSLYGTDIILILLLILYLFNNFQLKFKNLNFKFKNNYIWLFIGLLELGAFISIFFASNKILAVFAYARLLLGIGLFAVVSCAAYDKIKLLYSFLAGIFLQAVLGVWQFLNQKAFAFKWLGLACHSAKELGASVIETNDYERWLRAYGGLDHPNMLGGLLAVGLIILITALIGKILNFSIEADLPSADKQFPFIEKRELNNNFYKFFIFYFLFFIFLTALIFTFSRAAWLAVILGIISSFFILIIKKDYPALKKLGKVILAGGALFFILFNLYGSLFLIRLNNNTRLENKSISERAEYYSNFKIIIKENWFLGVGMGNYTLAEATEFPGRPSYYYQPAHNAFLLVWAEAGIIGFLGFLGFLGWKIGKQNLMALPIFILFLPLLFFDHWLASLHFGLLLFWFIAGWLSAANSSIIKKYA